MQLPGNQAAQKVWRYATTGLDCDANAALRSMMDVLRGRTHKQWLCGEPLEADVVFLGANGTAPPQRATQRHIIRVVRHGEGNAGYAHQIEYPFRVFQLLSVMRELEDDSSPGATPAAATQASQPSWSLFDAIHRLAADCGTGRWQTTGSDADGAVLFVRDDLQEFVANPQFESALAMHRIPQVTLTPCAPPPATMERTDPIRLLWCIGLYSGLGQLSGSLDASVPYRLRAWPDFGRLRGDRDHLRLSALLAADAYRRDELATHLGGDPGTHVERVSRFLNACSASGLLRAEHRDAPPAPERMAAGGFVGGLMNRLRNRLGFGASLARGY